MRSRSCSASSHDALPPVDPNAPYEPPPDAEAPETSEPAKAAEPGKSELQFDRAEPIATVAAVAAPEAPGLVCLRCRTPLPDQFWEVNGHATCAPCRTALIDQFTGPIAWKTWGRVLLYGGGAALLGTLVYFAVLKLTGYEFGLIAIGVGLLVGTAVRRAAGFRGGWRLQAAAMALTYASIVSSYMPSVYKSMVSNHEKKESAAKPTSTVAAPAPSAAPAAASNAPAPSETAPAAAPAPKGLLGSFGVLCLAVLFLFGVAAIAPIWAGFQNILGWVIIGFALYEAWKLNRRVTLVVRGPLRQSVTASGHYRSVSVSQPPPSE